MQSLREQKAGALMKANGIRALRAAVKRELREMPRYEAIAEAATIIAENPPGLATMRVVTLLEALPKFGVVKSRRLMNVALVGGLVQLGDLSERQRRVLVERLWREVPRDG